MELVGSDIAPASTINKPPHSWEDMSRLVFLRNEDNDKINNDSGIRTVKLEADTSDEKAGILTPFNFAPGIVQNATLGLSSTAVRAALKAGDAESVETLVHSLPFSVFQFLGMNSKIFLRGKIKDIDLTAFEADHLGRVREISLSV